MMFRPAFISFILITAALTSDATAQVTYHVGAVQEISQGCDGSAEVEQAVDPSQSKYVYAAWIGCGGIGFSRSTNGGVSSRSFLAVRSCSPSMSPSR